MKEFMKKITDIVVYLISAISFCIEGYYFYVSFETKGFKGIQYFFFSIAGFIISILFLLIYLLIKYIYKKRKK